MSISILAISFDARDAGQLAHFWAEALTGPPTTAPRRTSRRSRPTPAASLEHF
jgi:hypothetical protein